MKKYYWKAIIRYGHVGRRNEVSVARHLAFDENLKVYEIMKVINGMPGTKNRSLRLLYQIDKYTYELGLEAEKDNFYLQNLFGVGA